MISESHYFYIVKCAASIVAFTNHIK